MDKTKTDSFYSESNKKALEESIKELEERKTVTKTLEELKEMEKENKNKE
jgi:hypothetical protein